MRIKYTGTIEVKPIFMDEPFMYPNEVREFDEEKATILLANKYFEKTDEPVGMKEPQKSNG